jgi:hypothetical protein
VRRATCSRSSHSSGNEHGGEAALE